MAEPEISVVTATHQRADRLSALLVALERQTLGPERFEVVVVDDGSSDETPRVLAEASARGQLDLQVMRRERAGGPATARNTGWRAARGGTIAFTDDDCKPTPEWLSALVEAGAGRPERIVQGRTEPDPAERELLGPFARTVEVTGPSPYFQTCNIAYPRGLLEELGGFNESFPVPAGEDGDLGHRALCVGALRTFAPEAVVYHAVEMAGPAGTLRRAMRVTGEIPAFRLNPELRAILGSGVFYKSSHPLFLQAALALGLATRHRPTALFALPYALHMRGRAQRARGSLRHVPFFVLHDAVEIAATIRGAVRYRTLVI